MADNSKKGQQIEKEIDIVSERLAKN